MKNDTDSIRNLKTKQWTAAFDAEGNLFICDIGNDRIRRVELLGEPDNFALIASLNNSLRKLKKKLKAAKRKKRVAKAKRLSKQIRKINSQLSTL